MNISKETWLVFIGLDKSEESKIELHGDFFLRSHEMSRCNKVLELTWTFYGGELYVCMGESIKVDGLIERRLLLWIERDYWINNIDGEYWICRKVL